ncbi:MFS transporter [Alicyclobacillus macrosporangiidus]|uniref:MFS transporter n=1 Tax=Alicyclobacillus macrosporangiidus TaxID=392015 RepID=UPI00068D90E9|nr:MFS transporter [Alicyclobacillus macrosporangiidus]
MPKVVLENNAAAARSTRYRSTVLLLMFLGAAINYMDRGNIGVAAPLIAEHFHLNSGQMGIVLSSVLWTYTIAQIPMGILIDKYGPRVMVFLGVLIWSIMTVLTGATGGFISLLLVRMALGLGEAPTFPAFGRVVSQWFPSSERGTANASFISAVMFGSAFTPPLVTWLMLSYGWRSAFYVTGFLSLVWTFVWWKYFRNRPSESKYVSEAEAAMIGDTKVPQTSTKMPWYSVLRYRNVWGLMVGLFSIDYVLYIFVSWLPTYLVKAKHLTLAKTGFVAMIPYIVAFVLVWIFGIWSDHLVKRGWAPGKARRTLAVVGMVISLSILIAPHVQSTAGVVLFLSLALGGVMAANGVIWALPAAIATPEYVGRIGSFQNFAGNVGGTLAPLLTGFILQATGSFVIPLTIGGLLAVAAIISYIFLMHEQEVLIGDRG